MGNKIYPIGIQNFESLRLDGYFYIDKHRFDLSIGEIRTLLFPSRPRRFGKSLLISTLELISKGKRNFFKDWLWKNWKRTGQNIPYCTLT